LQSENQESLRKSIRLIPGVELSARWGSLGIHIVGLQVDIDHALLQKALKEQQSIRALRAEEIARRLEKAGISNALDGAQRYLKGSQLGRPHFAEYLVAQGYVKNRQAAFKKYLGTGKIGDVKNVWPEMERVIEWIHCSGGIAVLAHPMQYKLTARRLAVLVEAFADAGGKAVEIAVPGASAQAMQRLVRLAGQHELFASQGSDFHAPVGAWQQVGRMPVLPKEAIPVWEYWQ